MLLTLLGADIVEGAWSKPNKLLIDFKPSVIIRIFYIFIKKKMPDDLRKLGEIIPTSKTDQHRRSANSANTPTLQMKMPDGLLEEEKLLVAERKILRKILGPVKNEDGIWRIRKNKEIEDIVREPNIIGESKAARLRWLGHVERMEEDRAVKKAYLGRPMGKRPVGRPRYRWTDEVIKDLNALQKPDWKQTAQNREEWRAVVSEAKIHFGFPIMDNQLKQFSAMGSEENWRTQGFRQSVVSKIEQVIQQSGMQVARNSSEMENHVFMKAKTREEYMNMVAKLILHVREMSQQPKQNQGGPSMQGPNQNPPGPNQQGPNQPGQPQSGPNSQSNMAPDPINALQNLASQGSRNQMMNMGPQGQMQQQLGPNPGMGGLQGQMGQQGPNISQGPQAQTATNLLQTLNQRPQLNMQLPNKMGGGMGMVPNQGQMGPMGGGMGGMNPMGSQLQSQLAGPMQGQMMPNMSMPNSMQVPMSGSNTMGGGMGCNQVSQMGQLAPNQMQQQMGMGNSQMMSMLHMQGRVQNKSDVGMLGGGYPPNRAPQPFLRQSPSPSAPSPMGGPSPVSMGGMAGTMSSPMSSLGGLGCGAVGSPSPSGPSHLSHHPQHQQR
ncbi:hypothetical protein NE865_14301 [Phthorimaea operculella]|nr:hypothetical protein NE865_14301 [Phthorimaea operculella]